MMKVAAWEALGVWATFFATGTGLFLVRQQIKQTNRNLHASTSERLSAQSFDVIRFLADCPGSYRYFYEGQKIDKDAPERERLLYAAEALTNYIENVVSQLDSMDDELAEAWRHFIVDTYRKSPVVQDHLRENASWYDPELIKLLKKRGVWVQ